MAYARTFEDRFGRLRTVRLLSAPAPHREPAGPLEELLRAAFGEGERVLDVATAAHLRHVAALVVRASRPLDVATVRRALHAAQRTGVLRVTRGQHVSVVHHAPKEAEAPPSAPPVEEAPTWFEARLVDRSGEPLRSVAVRVRIRQEDTQQITDGDGRFRVDHPAASRAVVQLADVDAARALLTRRVITPGPSPAGAMTLAVAEGASVALAAETPTVLVVALQHHRVRLVGMHFDTAKCFLLPTAMHGIRQVRAISSERAPVEVLIVGHSDATGAVSYNETLSLERAQSIVAYLRDDVAAWDAWFDHADPDKRWGRHEIDDMLSALPDDSHTFVAAHQTADAAAVERFQAWANEERGESLEVDGVVGPLTRKAIVAAYMGLDGTTLDEAVTAIPHGCGPHHPLLDATGQPLADEQQRRVDVFVFHGHANPPPPGSTSHARSTEYDSWVEQMTDTYDVEADPRISVRIWVQDHLRRIMPQTPYRLTVIDQVRSGVTDERGVLVEQRLPDADTCWLEWGELDADDPARKFYDYRYSQRLHLETEHGDDAVDRKLHNLALGASDRPQALSRFEALYQRAAAEVATVHLEGLEGSETQQ